MKKNDLDYLKKRIDILGARMENATPEASFYSEMAQEQSALKRVCLKFEELEKEKAELVELLKQSLDLFPLGVGAMADVGIPENQIRCGKEAKELYQKINKAVNG